MGLKTTNYEIKNLGITLQQAYAVIKSITADRGHCNASFAVSTSRENALNKQPLETVNIDFEYSLESDNIDLFALAYEKAKGMATRKRWVHPPTHLEGHYEEYEEAMPFNGWTDDIR